LPPGPPSLLRQVRLPRGSSASGMAPGQGGLAGLGDAGPRRRVSTSTRGGARPTVPTTGRGRLTRASSRAQARRGLAHSVAPRDHADGRRASGHHWRSMAIPAGWRALSGQSGRGS
jgi:hypothetical protein